MSDQLPIELNPDQIGTFTKLMDRVMAKHAEAIEIRQSRGPVATHAIFVKFSNAIPGTPDQFEDTTYVISHNGDMAEWKMS